MSVLHTNTHTHATTPHHTTPHHTTPQDKKRRERERKEERRERNMFKYTYKCVSKQRRLVAHVSVHTLTFHETHYPLSLRGTNTIQYLIPGKATNVELLNQVKNWQNPLRDTWSNCLSDNSWETTKGQTNYYSGRQKRQFKDNLRKRRVCHGAKKHNCCPPNAPSNSSKSL